MKIVDMSVGDGDLDINDVFVNDIRTNCHPCMELSSEQTLTIRNGEEIFEGVWYAIKDSAFLGYTIYDVFVELHDGQVWYCNLGGDCNFHKVTNGWDKMKELLNK